MFCCGRWGYGGKEAGAHPRSRREGSAAMEILKGRFARDDSTNMCGYYFQKGQG
jgi:hypothetical protein